MSHATGSTAPDILQRAAAHIADRAATRDLPQGERSMARTVAAFTALTGKSLTEAEGWLFMVCLKAARATAGGYNPDDAEDGAAYFALFGEAQGAEQKPEGAQVREEPPFTAAVRALCKSPLLNRPVTYGPRSTEDLTPNVNQMPGAGDAP